MPSKGKTRGLIAGGLALLLVLVLSSGLAGGGRPSRDGPIGLFTTLPLVWPEADGVAATLRADAAPHWARSLLESRGRMIPIDALATAGGKAPLAGLRLLVIAQPRPLSPRENVALDDWVRGGGRLLLLADPLLTHDSAFALGDRRRPQDVVLLSPILARWGLALAFDADQPAGERSATVLGAAVPVNLPGRFILKPGSGCRLLAGGLAARCRIGQGQVLALADAAVLEAGAGEGARQEAFSHLLDLAETGD